MASLSNSAKYSLKYDVASTSDEKISRTIGGLNVGVASGSGTVPGATRNTAIGYLLGSIDSLSAGNVVGARWVDEREVVF